MSGDIRDRVGRPTECGQLVAIDPSSRFIASHLYQGIINIIVLSENSDAQDKLLKMSYSMRVEELQVIDIAFILDQEDEPLLVILYQDSHMKQHLRTYHVDMKEEELKCSGWRCLDVCPGASHLIPVPAIKGGVLITGSEYIGFVRHGQKNTSAKQRRPSDLEGEVDYTSIAVQSLPREPSNIECFGVADREGLCFLLGDHRGDFYMIDLTPSNDGVSAIATQHLGKISIPTAIAYLDNRYVYIGSHLGDAQLVRLRSEPDENNSHVEVTNTYPNIAPISDLCTIDRGLQGQDCIVTCSGGYHHGSLRIIRSGVGLIEHAVMEMANITGIWSIRPSDQSAFVDTIVMAFIGETRVLRLDEDQEMAELDELGSLCFNMQTLYAGNMDGDLLVQVTPAGVHLLDLHSGTMVHGWTPANGQHITVACASQTQLVVALPGGLIFYLELQNRQLVEVATSDLKNDVACMHMSSVESALPHTATMLAVGLWSENHLLIYRLPGLNLMTQEKLSQDITPRSVAIISLDGVLYVAAGMGDGQLIAFVCNAETLALSGRTLHVVGTQSVSLVPFTAMDGGQHVFAASDRPAVGYGELQRLTFSGVNLQEAKHICSFNSAAYPGCLAIVSGDNIIIGAVDEVRRLHIRSIPLGEMPRRICHQPSTGVLGVLTMRTETLPSDAMDLDNIHADSVEEERSYLRVFDANTFDPIDFYRMEEYELVEHVSLVTFKGSKREYFVVGTGFTYEGDMYEERTDGRILVFDLEDRKRLRLVTSRRVPGGVFQVCAFSERLLACVNSRVCIYDLEHTENGIELVEVCEQRLHIAALRCAIRGDFIAVGDLLRSVSLLSYLPNESTLSVMAHDYNRHWVTALSMLRDEVVLAADGCFNLYTVLHRSDEADEDMRQHLEEVGMFHLGDQVNQFCSGSLAAHFPGQTRPDAMRLFGTTAGMLGVAVSLTAEQYEILHQLSCNMEHLLQGFGGLDHASWRAYQDEYRTAGAFGIIDGDYVKPFLDLPLALRQAVVEGRPINTTHGKRSRDDEDIGSGGRASQRRRSPVSSIDGKPLVKPLSVTVEELTQLLEELARLH
ncbi:mono-functional DNA-alkylating methyl methanesulfonate N-term-domain-containing protein [Thamnocephalis sphaerospora]|uniref:DNA damage-binding protein 1 n=1 Tax=Thamnocephalis sphaerospora TaxID=78915 RepID=A0A4P9XKP0_9FUNG|nr:mono-functional DNA-alkylating methyl methanesulfonate N-term-domain-containing protein [Thamnocephalis sphaerospora]|eukprot:RKP06326.1 mono-functional DNA-alkylating methyl methanesulfonate N-term-domain-containing protein [Thamnocephalis sphaerospora]